MKKSLLSLLFLLAAMTAAQAQNCQAWVWPTAWAGGTTTLTANDSASAAVVSYLWNNGATTSSIDVTSPGTYCCVITYADGCTASGCYSLPDECWASAWWYWLNDDEAHITSWGGPTYMGSTYLWSNGATTADINVTVGGTYCVTITKDNGCTATACVDIPSTDCYVDVEPWYWPDSTVQFHAVSGSDQIISYYWNTGETTEAITPSSPGYYCVTVTDATGCVATGCLLFGDTTCHAYVYPIETIDDFHVKLKAYASDPNSTFLWNTSETTSEIIAEIPGDYCVTITNSNGCSASDCYSFPNSNYMYVAVEMQDSIDGIFAEIYLIQYDTTQGGVLTAIDTIPTNGGGGVFIPVVPAGQYLVKAALVPGAPHYSEYLPTYYEQELFWNNATSVTVLPSSPTNYGPYLVINLIPGQNPGGPGFIGGLVSEGANFTAGAEANRTEGDPMAGVQIILRRDDDTPVAATRTAADGTFGFDDLAWGTYRVSVDIPGIDPLHQLVTIGPDQPAASAVDFTVEGLGASAVAEIDAPATLLVRPNPVHDVLTVDLSMGSGELTLTNAQGQTVLQRSERGSIALLDVHSLPEGLYFLTLRTGNQSVTTRINKM